MKDSKDGVYLTPIRHRESKLIYRNGYLNRDTSQWHLVDGEGTTYIYPFADCEYVFKEDCHESL
jgi:hypothetical protein